MARAGLSPERVISAASALVDADGAAGLTLGRLADSLGVKTPSLYNHVKGLDDVRREVAISGLDRLAEATRSATMGRAGRDALVGWAGAYRRFALEHPGVYGLTQLAVPDDAAYAERAARLVESALAIFAGYGLSGDDAIHAARTVRSALHGFVTLETGGGFGIDLSRDDSFDSLVALLDRGLRSS